MGITGLLPLLKSIQRPTHVKDYKGKTYGVDSYVWLHRGAYTCAQELALGENSQKFVKYVMQRVRMLKHFGVTPFMVFDGAPLPSKRGTEEERARKRAEALQKAKEFLAQGNLKQARDFFVKAVDITPLMACQLIQALKAEGVQYVVAPYEADAQLAYLEKKGIIDGIITEDSDLLVFGCKNVLFKLDSDGSCVEISRDRFGSCHEYNLVGWSDVEFRQMAILSGCDYIPSIVGLGIKTAHRLMRQHRTAKRVIQSLRIEGQYLVPRDYEKGFHRAELTYLYQRVFNPITKSLDRVNSLDTEMIQLQDVGQDSLETFLEFAGPDIDSKIACAIAYGEIDPETYLTFQLENLSLLSTQSRIPFSSKSNIKSNKIITKPSDPGQKDLKTFFSSSPLVKVRNGSQPKISVTPSPSSCAPRFSNLEAESPLGVASRFFSTKSKNKTDLAHVNDTRNNFGMISLGDDEGPGKEEETEEEYDNIPTSEVCNNSPKAELPSKKRRKTSQESETPDEDGVDIIKFERNANISTPPTSDIDISSCNNSSPHKSCQNYNDKSVSNAPENLWSHVFVFDPKSSLTYQPADNRTHRAKNISRTSSAPNSSNKPKVSLTRSNSARSSSRNSSSFSINGDDSEQSDTLKTVTANWRARFSSGSSTTPTNVKGHPSVQNETCHNTPVKMKLDNSEDSSHRTPVQRLTSYSLAHQSIPSNKKIPREKVTNIENTPRKLTSSSSPSTVSQSTFPSPSQSIPNDISLGILPSSTSSERGDAIEQSSPSSTPLLMTPTSALERFRFKRSVPLS